MSQPTPKTMGQQLGRRSWAEPWKTASSFRREKGFVDRSIADILLEFCGYTDGAWMSAKKDSLVNIGGWLAVNDETVFAVIRNMVVHEGLHT